MALEPFEPDVSKWDAWHPSEVARRLAGVDARWAVIAGWSLDLFRGRQTREHEDLEIAVPESEYAAIVAALSGYEHFAIRDGLAVPASPEALEGTHQTWVREPETGSWRLDVMREPWDGDEWICRRDPAIRLAGSRLIAFTADGIPYQQPEIALLFKAKHVREKDEADLDGVLPILGSERRAWLAHALARVHPGHAWIERVRAR